MLIHNLPLQQAARLAAQIAQAITSYLEDGVWKLEFELPDGCVERPTRELDLSKPRAVIYDGDREAPLSTQQHALLKFVVDSGGIAPCAAVGQDVWGDELVTTNSIRQCVKRINAILLDHDIPCELSVSGNYVSLS